MKLFNIFNGKKQEQRHMGSTHYIPFSDAISFGHFYDAYGAINLSAVFRAVDLISDSVAMLPINIKNRADDDCVNNLPNHPLKLIFDNGNGEFISKFDMIKKVVWDMYVNGNGYLYINRANDGTPTGLIYCSPCDVTHYYMNNIASKRNLYYICHKVSNKKIEPINMIHLYKVPDAEGIHGLSILDIADRTINIANQAENNAEEFYGNGSNLAGYLKVDGPSDVNQRKDIKTAWQNNFANGKAGVAVLPQNVDYKPISVNPKDSQLLESRAYNTVDIARFFGISPILLGDYSKMAYNSIEQVNLQFITQTLQPLLCLIQEEFQRKLIKKSEVNTYIEFDVNALLKIDKNSQANYYEKMLRNGIMCINEIRKEMGLSPIEGGDKHLIAYTDIEQNIINKDNQSETDEQHGKTTENS